MAMSIYLKRPRVGTVLSSGLGPVTVEHVYRRGIEIDARDRINRVHRFVRAPHGVWVKAL